MTPVARFKIDLMENKTGCRDWLAVKQCRWNYFSRKNGRENRFEKCQGNNIGGRGDGLDL